MKMHWLILPLLVFSVQSMAAIGKIEHVGQIRSFDLKFVTIEIAGSQYKFHRAKLGPDFTKKIKVGDEVIIEVDRISNQK